RVRGGVVELDAADLEQRVVTLAAGQDALSQAARGHIVAVPLGALAKADRASRTVLALGVSAGHHPAAARAVAPLELGRLPQQVTQCSRRLEIQAAQLRERRPGVAGLEDHLQARAKARVCVSQPLEPVTVDAA